VTHRDTSSSPPHPQETPLQRFGATLRQYRQQRRLSQQALAARTGLLDDRYLSQIELGRHNISVLLLLGLARALEMPAACLLAPVDTSTPLASSTRCGPRPASAPEPAEMPHDDTPTGLRDDRATLLRRLGAALRQSRQQVGLSQPALAARTGLHPTYISQIEHGHRNFSMLSLVRIAAAVGVTVATLLAPFEPR
jgi:transcriptional regulator with XRE-family HTH domain